MIRSIVIASVALLSAAFPARSEELNVEELWGPFRDSLPITSVCKTERFAEIAKGKDEDWRASSTRYETPLSISTYRITKPKRYGEYDAAALNDECWEGGLQSGVSTSMMNGLSNVGRNACLTETKVFPDLPDEKPLTFHYYCTVVPGFNRPGGRQYGLECRNETDMIALVPSSHVVSLHITKAQAAMIGFPGGTIQQGSCSITAQRTAAKNKKN